MGRFPGESSLPKWGSLPEQIIIRRGKEKAYMEQCREREMNCLETEEKYLKLRKNLLEIAGQRPPGTA